MLENLNPLVGKPYVDGLQDCYTLAIKYYQQEFGIELTDYARPTNWYLSNQYNFFEKLYSTEGFTEVGTNPRGVTIGDMILMCVGRSEVINHCAIYVGQGKILHHLVGQYSKLEAYSDKWRIRVKLVIRHPYIEKVQQSFDMSIMSQAPHQVRQKMRGDTE